jgi:hypothetical protein
MNEWQYKQEKNDKWRVKNKASNVKEETLKTEANKNM